MRELDAQRVIVTATRRLARQLQLRYAQLQLAAGRRAWPTPRILPLSLWFEQLRNEYAERCLVDGRGVKPPRLLSREQERSLWERIIEQDATGSALLHVAATAESAMEAWRLSWQWDLPASRWPRDLSADSRQFRTWADALLAEIGDEWLDSARLPDHLGARLDAWADLLPRRVTALGFDAVPPQWRRFARELAARDCHVEWVEDCVTPGMAQVTGCADAAHELQVAALWTRQVLQREPGAAIGVVVPDLGARRRQVLRIFSDVLVPQALAEPAAARAVFNVSLGQPLADYAMVQAAFAILELAGGSLPLAQWGDLMRSPWIAGTAQELGPRLRFELWLRERGESSVLLAELAGHSEISAHIAATSLAQALRSLAGQRQALEAPRELRGWIEIICSLLRGFGWPARERMDSDGLQLYQAWTDALEALGQLDGVTGPCSYGRMLQLLQRLARAELFQPESAGAPVQILGALETAGLEFDYLWVSGCTDEALPLPVKANPFLPWLLQRQAGVPLAAADSALAFSRSLVQHWRGAARRVLFSFARREGDRAVQPSPLLDEVPVVDCGELAAEPPVTWRDAIAAAGVLTIWSDERGPALSPGEPVRGGASLFKSQADCPFRAFAQFRLAARALPEPGLGLDGGERGTLVHEALNRLWGVLRDHARLCALDEAQLRTHIEHAVEAVLQHLQRRRPQTCSPRFLRLERLRLVELLRGWIEVEKARSPFVVLQSEQERTFTIGALSVKARIDRIDQLDSDDLAVIDYKTGAAELSPKAWFGRRPDEPQLPLYAVGIGQSVACLAYALLRPGKLQYDGVARRADVGPKIRSFAATPFSYGGSRSWHEQLSEWRADLAALAEEFRAGHAPVQPKDGAKTCQRCDLTMLCRIHEQHVAAADADEGLGHE